MDLNHITLNKIKPQVLMIKVLVKQQILFIKVCHSWAMVVAQLVEWLLLTPEVRGSNPVMANL